MEDDSQTVMLEEEDDSQTVMLEEEDDRATRAKRKMGTYDCSDLDYFYDSSGESPPPRRLLRIYPPNHLRLHHG
jgi:hypothetical protein